MVYNFFNIDDAKVAASIIKQSEFIDEDVKAKDVNLIAKAAVRSIKLDGKYKMNLLAGAWMQMCGISGTWRDVICDCGDWVWNKFGKSIPELEKASELPCKNFFSVFNSDYSEEEHGSHNATEPMPESVAGLLVGMKKEISDDTFAVLSEGFVYWCDYMIRWNKGEDV